MIKWLRRRKERKMWKAAHRAKIFFRMLDEATTRVAQCEPYEVLGFAHAMNYEISKVFLNDARRFMLELHHDYGWPVERITKVVSRFTGETTDDQP